MLRCSDASEWNHGNAGIRLYAASIRSSQNAGSEAATSIPRFWYFRNPPMKEAGKVG
ncbi:MAG: hypothetical protein DIJKHBIC_00036 [Thermoanaerobaculia bacterium]|nr:hypothetical protein [Thermoanaerobaculia bacterium]